VAGGQFGVGTKVESGYKGWDVGHHERDFEAGVATRPAVVGECIGYFTGVLSPCPCPRVPLREADPGALAWPAQVCRVLWRQRRTGPLLPVRPGGVGRRVAESGGQPRGAELQPGPPGERASPRRVGTCERPCPPLPGRVPTPTRRAQRQGRGAVQPRLGDTPLPCPP
jgi:hypothetical protein